MIRLFSWFIIPFLTLFMPGKEHWIHANFSMAGSEAPRTYYLFFWGLLTGGYFYFLINRITKALETAIPVKWERYLAKLTILLLFITITLPYRPDKAPLTSSIHVFTAFSSSILFYLVLVILDFKTYFVYPEGFSRITAALLGAATVFVILFAYAGYMISSLLEVVFTVFSCIWLGSFHNRIMDSLPTLSTAKQKN